MAIDRELLLRAWPKGYVAMRGVMTHQGRWQCTRIYSNGVVLFDDPGEYNGQVVIQQDGSAGFGETRLAVDLTDGRLLPNVDPTDTATWACLLHDLATAAGLDPINVSWFPVNNNIWRLLAGEPGKGKLKHRREEGFVIPTGDPAEALVRARIELREGRVPVPIPQGMKSTDERYREVPCPEPTCMARAGMPCRAPEGRAVAYQVHHKARQEAYHRGRTD